MRSRRRSESKLVYGKMPDESVFDDHGDLQLIVNETQSFTVCSRTLARASPTFNYMLYGGFAESRPPRGEWVVHLPDERAYGLHILLDVIHGNHHKIDKNIFVHTDGYDDDHDAALELLAAVATTADKYDIVDVFSPWTESWVRSGHFRQCDREDGWRVKLIWAAWVFGSDSLLRQELDAILLSAFLGEDNHGGDDVGQCHQLRIKDHWNNVMPLHHPKDMEDSHVLNILGLERFGFATKRLEAVKSLIRAVKVAQNAAVAGRWKCRKTWHDHTGDMAHLQSHFFQALAHVNLSPLPDPETYKGSIRELYGKIQKLETKFLNLYHPNSISTRGDVSRSAQSCFLSKMAIDTDKIFRQNWDLALTDSQRAHLRRQRGKSRVML